MGIQSSGARGPFDQTLARDIIDRHAHLEGAMLPILHALQEQFGYIDAAALPLIAEALNVSHAEVHGVVTFYNDFRHAPAGQHVLKICRAESCQAMGVESLVDRLQSVHRLSPGETSADGGLTIENVYCLGHCALSPAALYDGEPMARLDDRAIDAIVLEATGARA
jgi:formate dehydrogenase subunit gamma